jgi:hypothetical protein
MIFVIGLWTFLRALVTGSAAITLGRPQPWTGRGALQDGQLVP